jgi:hypothetical protein
MHVHTERITTGQHRRCWQGGTTLIKEPNVAAWRSRTSWANAPAARATVATDTHHTIVAVQNGCNSGQNIEERDQLCALSLVPPPDPLDTQSLSLEHCHPRTPDTSYSSPLAAPAALDIHCCHTQSACRSSPHSTPPQKCVGVCVCVSACLCVQHCGKLCGVFSERVALSELAPASTDLNMPTRASSARRESVDESLPVSPVRASVDRESDAWPFPTCHAVQPLIPSPHPPFQPSTHWIPRRLQRAPKHCEGRRWLPIHCVYILPILTAGQAQHKLQLDTRCPKRSWPSSSTLMTWRTRTRPYHSTPTQCCRRGLCHTTRSRHHD